MDSLLAVDCVGFGFFRSHLACCGVGGGVGWRGRGYHTREGAGPALVAFCWRPHAARAHAQTRALREGEEGGGCSTRVGGHFPSNRIVPTCGSPLPSLSLLTAERRARRTRITTAMQGATHRWLGCA